MSIEPLSLAIPVGLGLLPRLRVRTAQVLPEASIARRGLPMVTTPIERLMAAGFLINPDNVIADPETTTH